MNLREQIMQHEGWKEYAYEDSRGYLTIGYGHLIDKRRGGGISRRIGALLLDDDLYAARAAVDKHWPWAQEMSQARYEVLINMAFNLGAAGVLSFRKMLAAAQAGKYAEAADEMLDSKWARQVGLRAAELSQQMRTGRWKE